MKKLVSLLCLLLMASLVFTVCYGEEAKITELSDLNGKIVATVTTPQDPEMARVLIEKLADVNLKEMYFYSSLSTAIAALKSNQVDAVIYGEMALNYYASRNENLITISPIVVPGLTTGHMVLRAGDTDLLNRVNAALTSLREDGTLAALEKEFITDLTLDQQLMGKEMPHFDGAPTLIVGISGDLPPRDYIAADGKPAGYNVELLARMGELLQMNIEILELPLESKFPSLSSNKIDLFFFHGSNADLEMTNKTMETNSNAVLTVPYCEGSTLGVLVAK